MKYDSTKLSYIYILHTVHILMLSTTRYQVYAIWKMNMFIPNYAIVVWCVEKIFLVKSDYNKVGVAVAMVISTMHDKSCIDSHNARKFD